MVVRVAFFQKAFFFPVKVKKDILLAFFVSFYPLALASSFCK